MATDRRQKKGRPADRHDEQDTAHVRSDDLDWKRRAPRWFLLLLLANSCAIAFFYEKKWRDGVDAHVVTSQSGYDRLAATEAAVKGLNDRVGAAEVGVNQLRGEVISMRKDQLEFYSFQARSQGYTGTAKKFEHKLKTITDGEAESERR